VLGAASVPSCFEQVAVCLGGLIELSINFDASINRRAKVIFFLLGRRGEFV
jgi:hypothetical protein